MSKLAYNVHVADENGDIKVFGPDDTVPAWARKKITNPAAWADGDADTAEPDTSGEGDEKPYSDWKVKDLKAEVAKRNEGRDEDDQIVPEEPGNKPELVAALEADDAAGDGDDEDEDEDGE